MDQPHLRFHRNTTLVQTAINTFELTRRSGFLANTGSHHPLATGPIDSIHRFGVYNDGIPRPLFESRLLRRCGEMVFE